MFSSTNSLVIAGALLALLGLGALLAPNFTTQQTKDVARVGDLKIQTQESTDYAVPPLLSGGALVLGLVMMGGGLLRRR